MKRREFLQIAGSMFVGAAVGGNAPNPVVFPSRPYNDPPPTMPEQLAGASKGNFFGFNAHVEYWVDGRRISYEGFCSGFACGNEPPAAEWEAAIVHPRG